MLLSQVGLAMSVKSRTSPPVWATIVALMLEMQAEGIKMFEMSRRGVNRVECRLHC